jgi:hypothetical protein
MNTLRLRAGLIVAAAFVGVVVLGSPAVATITETSGTTQPVMHGSQDPAGACAAGEHWVYVSSAADASYNPLAKTTDALGANSEAPPNGNADAFNDGVTIAISADGKSASFSVNEATDPSTTITIGKVVVKAGNHFTIYTGADAVPNTALTSPANAQPPVMGVSHAYVCYSVAGTPPVTPEVPYAIILPLAGVAIGAVALTIGRRRRRLGPA